MSRPVRRLGVVGPLLAVLVACAPAASDDDGERIVAAMSLDPRLPDGGGNTNDGFEVSRRDLELRGPGELLGTRQTGLMQLRVADLMRDADLLPRVQAAADVMLRSHADIIAPLKRRWIGPRFPKRGHGISARSRRARRRLG